MKVLVLKKIYLIISLSFFGWNLFAQDYVPYKCNSGLYGISDPDGNLVHNCTFESITINYQKNVFVTKKDKLYGLIDAKSGKTLVDPIFEHSPYWQFQIPKTILANETILEDTLHQFGSSKYALIFDLDNIQESKVLIRMDNYETQRFKAQKYFRHLIQYINNLFRIRTADGNVNFLHREKGILFKDGFINALALAEDRFAIERDNGLIAFADENGQNITKPEWYGMTPGAKDFFIVNSDESSLYSDGKGYSAKAGIIDKEGILVVDTTYDVLHPIFEDYLIARIEDQYGVIDYDGNIIVPIANNRIFPASLNKIYFGYNSTRVVDLSTGKDIETNAQTLAYQVGWELYKGTMPDRSSVLLDGDLAVLFKGDFQSLAKGPKQGTYLLHGGASAFFIDTDRSIKAIEASSLQVRRTENNDEYIIAKKDTLTGVYDKDCNLVLDIKYTDVIARIVGEELLWMAKPQGGMMYTWFNAKGKPVNREPIASDFFVSGKNAYKKFRQDGKEKLLLLDGSIRAIPDFAFSTATKTANGRWLIKSHEKKAERIYVLDQEFYNLLPDGFFIPRRAWNSRYLKSGVFAVYDDFRCGVLNDLGEWVVEPTEHAYQVYTPNLISKHHGDPRRYSPKGVDLMILKKGKWETRRYRQVKMMADYGYLRVSKYVEGKNVAAEGLIDSLGNEIIPLKYEPIRIVADHIVCTYSPTKETRSTDIYDIKGKLILSVPFVAKLDQNAKFLQIFDHVKNANGIMDWEKNVIIDIKYNMLGYFPELDMISYKEGQYPNTETVLATVDGKEIFRAKSMSTKSYEVNGKNRLAISSDGGFTLIDENYNILARHEFNFGSSDKRFPNYNRCRLKDNSYVYVNLETGKVMMDD